MSAEYVRRYYGVPAKRGMRVTITTDHTEATGVLQGFQHVSDVISDGTPMQDSWVRGQTRTVITLLPDQNIVAQMADEVQIYE